MSYNKDDISVCSWLEPIYSSRNEAYRVLPHVPRASGIETAGGRTVPDCTTAVLFQPGRRHSRRADLDLAGATWAHPDWLTSGTKLKCLFTSLMRCWRVGTEQVSLSVRSSNDRRGPGLDARRDRHRL